MRTKLKKYFSFISIFLGLLVPLSWQWQLEIMTGKGRERGETTCRKGTQVGFEPRPAAMRTQHLHMGRLPYQLTLNSNNAKSWRKLWTIDTEVNRFTETDCRKDFRKDSHNKDKAWSLVGWTNWKLWWKDEFRTEPDCLIKTGRLFQTKGVRSEKAAGFFLTLGTDRSSVFWESRAPDLMRFNEIRQIWRDETTYKCISHQKHLKVWSDIDRKPLKWSSNV